MHGGDVREGARVGNESMSEGQYQEMRGISFSTPPLKMQWAFSLEPDGAVQFEMVKAPIWIHRIMQRIILGIRWRRI